MVTKSEARKIRNNLAHAVKDMKEITILSYPDDPEKRRETNKRQHRLNNERKMIILNDLGGKCVACGYVPRHACEFDLHEMNGSIARKAGISRGYRAPAHLLRQKRGYEILTAHKHELVPLCRICHSQLGCASCKKGIIASIDKWKQAREDT